jgi:DNA repair exonuclease SbcCD ATPase subunit
MNKTRIDDMLMEMIEPKITEIEKKFANNQPLSQEDINTLLLKSQYNHINHLDEKLNEVTQSVKSLEHKFDTTVITLKNNFDNTVKTIKNDYEKLEQKFDNTVKELRSDYEKLEQKFDNTVKELKSDFNNTVKELRSDYEKLEQKFDNTVKELRSDYEKLEQKIETTIQKALNKNMMALIVVIGLFMTLSKLIDKFQY